MKYISMVFAILFCLSFTAPSSANDETQNNEQAPNKLFENMFRMPSLVDCGPPEMIQKMINEYKEKPLAEGNSFIIRPDHLLQQGPTTLYVNPDTGTWTMVIKYDPPLGPGIWCILNAGSKFGPSLEKTAI